MRSPYYSLKEWWQAESPFLLFTVAYAGLMAWGVWEMHQ
jgi:predicted negative regulator of RcsB-dependent stress response